MSRLEYPAALIAIHDEHRYVERLLSLLDDKCDRMYRRAAPNLELLSSILHYMTQYPDRYHHPKEDLIAEQMAVRRAGFARAAAKLRAEHRRILRSGLELQRRLDAVAATPDRKWLQQLGKDLRSYAVALREHMRLEEETLLLPALHMLGEADWHEIDRGIQAVVDPLFGDRVAALYAPVHDAYVNRINRFATGTVPFMLFESMASAAEEAYHAGARVGRLPWRLIREGTRNARSQFDGLGEWSKDPGFGSMVRLLRRSAGGNLETLRKSASLVRRTLFPGASEDHTPAGSGSAPIAGSTGTATGGGDWPFTQRGFARVSWQAVAMNLVLRLTIKQLMASISIERIVELRRFAMSRDIAIPGISFERADSQAFDAEWLRKDGVSTSKTILHLPGGGFVVPAMRGHKAMLARICSASGTQGLLLHYRLAPEHPFPAGLEDAIGAYRFLLDSGIAADDIVVMGDSAGGGLALSMLLALREQGWRLPAAAVLVSALTDLSFSTPSRTYNRWLDPMLPTRRKMRAYEAYSGDTPGDHPLLSPIYGDYAGFPPLLAQVSSTEILLEDTLKVARKARAQGVDFEVEVWEGMPHDWHLFTVIPEATAAIDRIAEFVSTHLGRRGARAGLARASHGRTATCAPTGE